jgi:hypothetical protein
VTCCPNAFLLIRIYGDFLPSSYNFRLDVGASTMDPPFFSFYLLNQASGLNVAPESVEADKKWNSPRKILRGKKCELEFSHHIMIGPTSVRPDPKMAGILFAIIGGYGYNAVA